MTTENKNTSVITRNETISLTPKLRFKEFEGDWEKKKLGDVGKVKMCKRVFSSETTEFGEVPFYKIGTFGKKPDAFITEEKYLDFKDRFSYPKIGEILMSASGTLGRTVVYKGDDAYFQDSNIVWLQHNEKLITNNFLYYIYQIIKYNSEGGTIQRLYNSIILSAKFYKPKLPEQQKIATFLTAVDTKLQQLNSKKSALETYKKGAMQQLFSEEIRFKSNDGSDFPDWEENKLGGIANLTHGDGDWILSKDISDNEQFKIVQLGNIGFGNYKEKILKTISKEKFIEIKGTLINKGDLLINRMVDGDLNCCIFNKNGDYITSVDVCWIRENEFFNNYFMMSLILFGENQNKLLSLSSGSGRVRISKNNLFNKFTFLLPSLKEQQKIATYLSAIDVKTESVQQQIKKTQAFKKGLLQQLFV